jgi:hypothetical protein
MPNKNSIEFYGNDHVMIDIETLGTNTDTVVTQIAAVSFNPVEGTILSEFNVHIDIQDSLNEGFTTSASTILWWFAQDEDARLNLIEKNKTGLKVRDALLEFKCYFHATFGPDLSNVKVWGNGSTFDINKMKTHFNKFNYPTPWLFWNERDVRTITAFDPELKESIKMEGIKHDGLADSRHQVKYLSAIINKVLNGTN